MLELPLKSIAEYLSLVAERGGVCLSKSQKLFLGRILTGMILLGSFKVVGIASLFIMQITPASIYAMFRRLNIQYEKMFYGALKVIIDLFKIRMITIIIDDTERERSKGCKILPFVRKAICKATGGWIQAQNLVFITLVTEQVTIPIWFCFQRPAKLTKEQKKLLRRMLRESKNLIKNTEQRLILLVLVYMLFLAY